MAYILLILGWILKIIGILLAAIVILLLLVIFLILVTPIRYQIDLTLGKPFLYGGKVSWLLRFLQLKYFHQLEENITEVYILGFRIKRNVIKISSKESKKDKLDNLEKDLWETDWQEIEEEEFKQKLYEYLTQDKEAKAALAEPEKDFAASGEPVSTNKTIDKMPAPSQDPDKTPEERAEMIEEAKEKDKDKIKDKDKAKAKDTDTDWLEEEFDERPEEDFDSEEEVSQPTPSLKEKVHKIWTIFQTAREYFAANKGLFRHVLYWLFRMAKSILPKKMDGDVIFGLNDPANTGYALGIFYLFYPANRGRINIMPDFDKFIIEGQLKIKGRVIFIVLLYYLLRMVLDIRIFRLIKLILKIRKEWNQPMSQENDVEA